MKKLMVLFIILSVLAVACSSNSENTSGTGDSDKIVIGGLGPLTGSVAAYGIGATNGTKIAFEEINENGGILGKQVEFMLEDEKGDPTEAINAYNKLSEQGVVAIIGDITSKPTLSVAEIAKEENLPLVTPTATMLEVTDGKPSVFRVCFTDPFQGEILANFASKTLKVKKVALLTNNSSDYSKGVSEAFKKTSVELGMDVVSDEGYGDEDKDFRAQLTNIAGSKPEVVIIPDYYEKVALIAHQAKEVGLEATLIGGDGWDGVVKQLDESSYDVVEGAYFANHYSYKDDAEKVANFVKKYNEKFGENPSAFAALGYDAAYIVKDAIEKAGSTDKEAIIKALKETDYTGVTGKLKFDENNNPVKSVTITKIENGEYNLHSEVSVTE